MKKFILIILAFAFCLTSFAVDTDSLNTEIRNLRRENAILTQKLAGIEANVRKQNALVTNLSDKMKTNASMIDSLKSTTTTNAENIKLTADRLGVELKTQNESLSTSIMDLNKSVGDKTAMLICACILLLIIIVVCVLLARKKSTTTDSSIRLLKDAQKSLEEQSLKLDNQLITILEKKMKAVSESTPANVEPDHSLPLKIADEIVRIQNNIDRMDASDKNVARLNKALERMKSSFMAYGYEIVDMRGQEYTDNMPFEARFIPDMEIEEGKRIISGMDRLMVRYNGKMIQTPILAVRQNV